MAEYNRYYPTPASRQILLDWPREIPIAGEPADVHAVVQANSDWLPTTTFPKLLFHVAPGARILPVPQAEELKSMLTNLESIFCLRAPDTFQEEHPDAIRAGLAEWVTRVLSFSIIKGDGICHFCFHALNHSRAVTGAFRSRLMSFEIALVAFAFVTLIYLLVELAFTYRFFWARLRLVIQSNQRQVLPIGRRIENTFQNQVESATIDRPVLAAAAITGLEHQGAELAAAIVIGARALFGPILHGFAVRAVPAWAVGWVAGLYR